MILYEVYDGENHRQVFRSKREAVKDARAWFKAGHSEIVWVRKLILPAPSVELVMSILNETGYVVEHIELLKLEKN